MQNSRESTLNFGQSDTGAHHLVHPQGAVLPSEINASRPAAEVVSVSISALKPGQSPRIDGEDAEHIERLAAMEGELPPILVERASMRVIDGMHRLHATSLRGRETIEVMFFDGSAEEAFLHAVHSNVTHGLPLSRIERHKAADRIICSHPHLSDRAIAQFVGLTAKTVGEIRRSSAAAPTVNARTGKDGRTRPVNSAEGRERAAELMMEHPEMSLREVARLAGISPGTVRDVRARTTRGDGPIPPRMRGGRRPGQVSGAPVKRGGGQPRPASPLALDKLIRDPSLRLNEQGRRLLAWLRQNPTTLRDRSTVINAIPPHCGPMIAQLAHETAEAWLTFAHELDAYVQVVDDQQADEVPQS